MGAGRVRLGGAGVSALELIERLCNMLDAAQKIIKEQAAILAEHGIETDSGEIERRRAELLDAIEHSI